LEDNTNEDKYASAARKVLQEYIEDDKQFKHAKNNKKFNVFSDLPTWLQGVSTFLLLVASIIGAWGTVKVSLNTLEMRVKSLETNVEKLDETYSALNTFMITTESDLGYTTITLDKLTKKVNIIETNLQELKTKIKLLENNQGSGGQE